MPIYTKQGQNEYQEFSYDKESDFEKVIVELSEKIFGPDSIYFDIKKRVKGKEIVSIPDGYVLDYANPNKPRLYILENEIVSHDPFKHIGNQMLRFVVSFDDAKAEIWDLLMAEIQSKKELLTKLEAVVKKTSFRNVDDLLNCAVYAEFSGIVVIDEIRPELSKVIEKIKANISVLEVKTFKAQDGSMCFHYDTLYEENEVTVQPTSTTMTFISPEERKLSIERKAKCDTIIVPAQEEGFNRVFLKENRWYAIKVGAAMKDKIKYIAGYQVAPISAITHIAEVKEIRPYKDSGKYELLFSAPALEITPIKMNDPKYKPQGPIYAEYSKLIKAKNLEEALSK